MMILESNVTFQWSSQVIRQMAYEISVQSHFDVRSGCLDFESVPFSERFDASVWLVQADRPHLSCAADFPSYSCWGQIPIIDLDFVAWSTASFQSSAGF